MPRKPRWQHSVPKDGSVITQLSSWGYFEDFIRQVMLDFRQFIWRGQACADWQLEPTLDRVLRAQPKIDTAQTRTDHLRRFQYATRGRRGTNPPTLQTDNDWWALGQHHGLMTPLLDWSTSPYVAAYFAFLSEDNGNCQQRAIYALARTEVESLSARISKRWSAEKRKGRPPIVEFIEPLSGENARLVSQGGLFTRGPDGVTLEQWAKDRNRKDAMLSKITIPNADRGLALRTLNRMNINHLSLFPDLYGAARYVNTDLLIERY